MTSKTVKNVSGNIENLASVMYLEKDKTMLAMCLPDHLNTIHPLSRHHIQYSLLQFIFTRNLSLK